MTTLRPEISKKSEFWLEKHRYYELKHFCLQYHHWMEMLEQFDGYSGVPVHAVRQPRHGRKTDQTERTVELRMMFEENVRIVETAAKMTDPFFADYLFKAATQGYAYEYLRLRLDMPLNRRDWYNLYRKFFWTLDQMKK